MSLKNFQHLFNDFVTDGRMDKRTYGPTDQRVTYGVPKHATKNRYIGHFLLNSLHEYQTNCRYDILQRKRKDFFCQIDIHLISQS